MTDLRNGPLSGILVVDLTRVLAGPYAALMLNELGARIIKVEPPRTGDDSRHIGPFVKTPSGKTKSGYFMSVNRGKESIALDLKADGDRRIFEALLARADVLIENYRGGTMEKLGYGYEQLKDKYPKLIYCGVSGFGHTGPYAQAPRLRHGRAGDGRGDEPDRPSGLAADARGHVDRRSHRRTVRDHRHRHRALRPQERPARGQKVDISMLDSQVALLENAISRYVATGDVPGPLGSRHPSIAPFAAFATKDGHIAIAAGNDDLFARVARGAGPRRADRRRALHHQSQARAELRSAARGDGESRCRRKPSKDWLALLDEAGVPCGPLNNVADVMADPQVARAQHDREALDPDLGPIRMQGNPIKLSAHDDPKTRARRAGSRCAIARRF